MLFEDGFDFCTDIGLERVEVDFLEGDDANGGAVLFEAQAEFMVP